jgi:hypothetical protein
MSLRQLPVNITDRTRVLINLDGDDQNDAGDVLESPVLTRTVNNRCPDAADNVVTESPGVALGHGNQFSRPPSRGN